MSDTREANAEPTGRKQDSAENEGRWTKRSFWLCTLHLFTLCSLALAKPLFDVTAKDASFYVVRGSRPVDIVSLILILSLLVPAALALVEWLAGQVNRRLRLPVHYLFVFILTAGYSALFVKHAKIFDGLPAVALIGAFGALGALLYARTQACRRLVSLASPVIVLFPALFVFGSQVGQIVKPHWLSKPVRHDKARHLPLKKKPPIVFVLMDELPVVSLLDARGNIDGRRFPNLAEFAKTATWFRNTTAVSAQTTTAVPAILTGVFPTGNLLPNLANHPDNLFTLLGSDYAFNVFESATFLCPPELATRDQETQGYTERIFSLASDLSILYLHCLLPDEYLKLVPSIDNQWGNFRQNKPRQLLSQEKVDISGQKDLEENITSHLSADRTGFFRRFVAKVGAGDRDSLNFVHVMLPHNPMEYLPSGRKHSLNTEVVGVTRKDDRFIGPQGLVDQFNYRHLLQMACMDRLVGELVARLKDRRIYDDALIIFVADHGASFVANDYNRRLSTTNVGNLIFVPLLIKAPGQTVGAVSDTEAQTVDILPTIADLLGIELPWKASGTSLYAPDRPSSSNKKMLSEDGSVHTFAYAQLLAQRDKAFARNVTLFGLDDERSTLFWFGRYRDLMGKPLAGMRIVKGAFRANADQRRLFEDVDLKSSFVPAKISGRISGMGTGGTHPALAIGVNGVIQGVADTFSIGADLVFSTVIPDAAFIEGKNDVRFFLIGADANGRLQLVSSESQLQDYQLGNGEITSPDNKRIPIIADALQGSVEGLALDDSYGDSVQVSGWAADTGKSKQVEAVLVFSEGKFVNAYRTTEERPDVCNVYKNQKIVQCGFRFLVPRSVLRNLRDIRLFALADGRASELDYAKDLGLVADYGKHLLKDDTLYTLLTNKLVSTSGETLTLTPGALQGSIDVIERKETGIELMGWAANVKQSRAVEALLFFADDSYIGSGKTMVSRPDVSKAIKRPKLTTCGFDYLIPSDAVKDLRRIRIFAVSQGKATELVNPL